MRRQRDFYETAPWQVDALVDHLPELSGSIWCPCVGDGSLMRQLQKRRPDLGPFVTNDINPEKPADWHGDAATAMCWNDILAGFDPPDWVIENPPFNRELLIAQYALKAARKGIVLMSRISFPEGTKDRGPWLVAHPRQQQITLERYSFTGNGKSDSTTTEWLVWAKVPLARYGGFTAYGYKAGTPIRPQALELIA